MKINRVRPPLVLRCVPIAAVMACGGRDHITSVNENALTALQIERLATAVEIGTMRVFSARGVTSSGALVATPVRWSSVGGTITPGGVYTAPAQPCECRIIAATSSGRLADTTVVSVKPAVAQIVVDPASAAIPVGASQVFSVRLLDSTGAAITRPMRWNVSDETIAAVIGESGLVTANADGPVDLIVESQGVRTRIPLTVVPSTGRLWPHEPIGFRPIADQPWDGVPSLGWKLLWGQGTIVTDTTAPHSPPSVLQIEYPIGFVGGTAPGSVGLDLPKDTHGLYAGLWWKVSDPWQGHASNVNKIAFILPTSGGDIILQMYGTPGGPYELRSMPQFPGFAPDWLLPNRASAPVRIGEWHRVEWLVLYGADPTKPSLGVSKWWLDGTLVGEHHDVPFPAGGLTQYMISPTWGGLGDVKTETDHYYIDHVYLSIR